MPELPEVETICRGLRPMLVGRDLIRVTARRADLRIPLPSDLAARLEGRRVERIDRRAKYILIRLDDSTVLIVHLGMSGRLAIAPTPPPSLDPHDHVIFELGGGARLIYRDPRRFGLITLATESELESHPLLHHLGVDPLAVAFDGGHLSALFKGRRTPIKAALLDQRVIAGLGNIYACESLFRARVSPLRLAASVAGRRAERLAGAIRSVLEEAIAAGGSSLRDYVQASGELGYFQLRLAVYGCAGQPCPGCDCGGTIRRIVQGGRSTFYCRHRQR